MSAAKTGAPKASAPKGASWEASPGLAALYIAPAALVMAAITFFPLLYGIWMAFTNYGVEHIRGKSPQFVGLQNFVDLFTKSNELGFNFFSITVFNFIWTFSNLFFHVGLGISLALLLNRQGLRGKTFYRAALILPWAVPTCVTALVWHNMFDSQFGAINLLLKGWGFAGVDWFSTVPTAFFAVLTTNVWLGFPFMMMVANGGLQTIPKDYYEAADMDGATKWKQFWVITVPMLRPTMIPAITLGFVWTFNNFNVIYFVSRGDPFGKTEILITQATKLVDPLGAYGMASAFAIVIFVILAVITMLQLRITRATEA